MFIKILLWLQKGINAMLGKSEIKRAMGVDVVVSSPMLDALRLWSAMYKNEADWLTIDIPSLSLPSAIAAEISRSTTIEMQVSIQGSSRAEFLSQEFEVLMKEMRQLVEYGAAKGGLMLKPYVSKDRIIIDYIQADQFYPVQFGANGKITACVFTDSQHIGNKFYTRLELHQMTEAGCVIKNQAFVSDSKEDLGIQVPLDTVELWKELEPEATIQNIEKPLFGYFKYPLANNIDSSSPLGVSCFARAVDLIKQADNQWSDFLWEFESARRALYVDTLAFNLDDDGNPILPHKRLYKTLNGTGNVADEALFEEWSPELREQNVLNGLDAILRRIEFVCGLAYGVLSNPATIDKTATELKISQQRSYSTIRDVQKALQTALEDLIYAMDIWATLHNLAPSGTYDVSYEFDDSILLDKEAQFTQDLRLVTQGIMSKVEFRMRNMGEDEKTAQEYIDRAQTEQPEEDLFGLPTNRKTKVKEKVQ